jgi:hypothetical protein
MSVCRFENGKWAEEWEIVDMPGVLRQIGAIPTSEGAGA